MLINYNTPIVSYTNKFYKKNYVAPVDKKDKLDEKPHNKKNNGNCRSRTTNR